MRKEGATLAGNLRPFDRALAEFPVTRDRAHVLLHRLEELLPQRPLSILEVGSAQGAAVVALQQQGHLVVGVEPWRPAIRTARQIGAHFDSPVEVVQSRAEDLPFADESFDLVVAFNVVEHVNDIRAAFQDAHRVLVPGGLFWFYSVSALHPGNQNEVGGLPLFPWYPAWIKRRALRWIVKHRPDRVGHADAPAVHWWTPRSAGRELRAAGFERVLDRWDLHTHRAGDSRGRRLFTELARGHGTLRLLGDVLVEGCAYAAVKPSDREGRPAVRAGTRLSPGGLIHPR